MSRFVIPNSIGHHEFPGVEVDVFDKQIIIRTFNQQKNWKQDQNREKPRDQSQKPREDNNMSLLSSIDKLAAKFGKK
jgi:hypothetical protein